MAIKVKEEEKEVSQWLIDSYIHTVKEMGLKLSANPTRQPEEHAQLKEIAYETIISTDSNGTTEEELMDAALRYDSNWDEYSEGGAVKIIEKSLVYHNTENNRHDTIGFIDESKKEINFSPFASKALRAKGEEWAKDNGYGVVKFSEGGSIDGKWFTGALSFLNW